MNSSLGFFSRRRLRYSISIVAHFIIDLLDFKVFIDARDDLKVIRRIKRDQIERNYPVEDVLYRYEHHVMPAYEQYIKPYKDKADVIINNHEKFENALDMVAVFIEKKINA